MTAPAVDRRDSVVRCRFSVTGACLATDEGFAPCDNSAPCDFEGFLVEGEGDDGPECS